MSAAIVIAGEFSIAPDVARQLTITSEDRTAWLADRRNGLGASDMPAVLGEDAYRSPLQVYMDKRGELPVSDEMAEAAELGLDLEPYLIAIYAKRYNRTVIHNRHSFVSLIHPWLRATPDGFDVTDYPDVMSVQVKVSGRKDWVRGPAVAGPEEDADDGGGDHSPGGQIPPYVYTQVQSEMLCVGLSRCVTIGLTSGYGPIRFDPYVSEADEYKQQEIIAAGRDMWRRIEEEDPPPPDGSKSSDRMLKLRYPHHLDADLIRMDADAMEWTLELDEIGPRMSKDKKRAEYLRQQLKAKLGHAPGGVLPDGSAWTYKASPRKGYTVADTIVRALRRSAKK